MINTCMPGAACVPPITLDGVSIASWAVSELASNPNLSVTILNTNCHKLISLEAFADVELRVCSAF